MGYDSEEFKCLVKHLASKKYLYKEDKLYHIFIGFYMKPFDTKMCEIIGNFGLYTRNDEEIIITLSLDPNPQYLNTNNCGVFSDKIETEIVLNGIKDCLGWLSTKYISYEIV